MLEINKVSNPFYASSSSSNIKNFWLIGMAPESVVIEDFKSMNAKSEKVKHSGIHQNENQWLSEDLLILFSFPVALIKMPWPEAEDVAQCLVA